MGAGAFGAGVGGAGAYVPAGSNVATVVTPRALKLDPLTRDFVVNADGQYVSCHPVEHEAMMRLIPALTTIRSANEQGARWRDLTIDEPEIMTMRVRELVLEVWRPMIARGDLRLERVAARPSNPWGRGRIEIEWTNLRDPQSDTTTTSL